MDGQVPVKPQAQAANQLPSFRAKKVVPVQCQLMNINRLGRQLAG